MDPAITTSPAAGVTQVVLGTRKSQLAIAQVDMIIGLLQAAAPGPEYKMQVVSTMADENQVKKFIEFNSKSIWTEELEQLLVGGTLDTVVHCVKGTSKSQSLFAPITRVMLTSHACRHANATRRPL